MRGLSQEGRPLSYGTAETIVFPSARRREQSMSLMSTCV